MDGKKSLCPYKMDNSNYCLCIITKVKIYLYPELQSVV